MNAPAIPVATSRGRVVRTGTSSVSTSVPATDRFGAADQIEADSVDRWRQAVKLKPENVGRDARDLFDRRAAGGGQRIGNAARVAPRGPR